MITETKKYPTGLTIFVDIDQTIAELDVIPNEELDYAKCYPLKDNIKIVNELYDSGNLITLYTARGARSGIDWRDVTEKQLKEWGVKYHELRLDKPFYDCFIDDKCINNFSELDSYLKKFKI